MVSEGVLGAKSQRTAATGQSALNGLGFANLVLGQVGCYGLKIGRQLQRLQFERGFFGGGFFLGLKVATNTNAIEDTLDAE